MSAGTLMKISGATVRYGETVAVDDVSITLEAGEVHALTGENGAGKSTLLRALAGIAPLAAGTISSCAHHLEWVPQELALAENLTVAEALFLGRERRSWLRLLARAQMRREAEAALRRLDCRLSPAERVVDLDPPVRKLVQLARAFLAPAGVLLLDEPTAVLGAGERDRLFAVIREARGRGAAVVYVSHRIDEVLEIADRVTVLRDGAKVSTDPVDAVDAATIVARMVGRALAEVPARGSRRGEARLRVHEVSSSRLRRVSFEVFSGEVVGLAGLVGAGRSELLEIIAGLVPEHGGRAQARGTLALVPEDRSRNGLVPTFSVRENVFLPAPGAWLEKRRERTDAQRWIERLRIRSPGTEAQPASLSGGNQQKVLLARSLRRAPDVLLLDEPTAGVDVGAKADIHAIIRAQADAGAAVLMASSDLPELLAVCDRIVALRSGRQVGLVESNEASEAVLAGLITGTA